jgi:hypothetical protein
MAGLISSLLSNFLSDFLSNYRTTRRFLRLDKSMASVTPAPNQIAP